jgi:hypothetical protein
MSILKAAYPGYYRDMKRQDAEAVVNLWSEMLADYPANLVAAAVKAHIAGDQKGFPPHIGAIIAAIGEVSKPAELTEGEAWALIARALRNGGYGSEREFAALPETLQRLVGHPSQLREWAMMDAGTVQTVVQSNFLRSYRARMESEKRLAAMPQEIRAKLTNAANQLPSFDIALAQRTMEDNA